MTLTLPDSIGWIATAIFTASYFTRRQVVLRRVQMAGASMWLAYGVVSQAVPVIVANILVLGAAVWAEIRERRTGPVPGDARPMSAPASDTSAPAGFAVPTGRTMA